MPTSKNHRRGEPEKNRKGKVPEKASSFHGRGGRVSAASEMLPRPKTVPEILSGRRSGGRSADEVVALIAPPKLTKLLLNVTIQRSLCAVRVVIPPEATVADLIAAALLQYLKEVRVSVLPSSDAAAFNLHYSQFSLESLDRAAKVIELGSRNFFLCISPGAAASTCSKEADKARTKLLPWLNFI
ncbi:uncharacterized protein At4g22758-like [Andrographis paniculata]|uniref:uncharacterized protein At4g22758-like n=1 Tax=Andrographis paniculata TaxID=175694 RepID=UPI0021E79F49|nr:uncharacterized protein At4g22758-like [Andrographis paniculata]